ncbi:hypothetical protein FQN54_000594 [Arachnomyces sp. PD_36]|nr:hypothetical protein FQN54_000594 [Arachnomyces sp. PD_36]
MISDPVSYHRSPKIAKPRKHNLPVRKTRHPIHSLFMAGPMPPSNEPVAISNPLTSVTNPILVSPNLTSASEPTSTLPRPAAKPDSSLSSIASAGLRTSPSASSPGFGKSSFLSPPPMATTTNSTNHTSNQERGQPQIEQNGANPGESRVSTLTSRESNGNQPHTSQDESRATNVLSDPMAAVAKSAQGSSDEMQIDNHLRASPGSMSNAGNQGGDNTTPTPLINNSTVASPGPIEESNSQDGERPQNRDEAIAPEEANKSFSYPVPMGAMNLNDPRRGMSLPHSGFHKGNPRSPSAKKHKCPYCSTEFTRHHNLKSHLLTHSQEKPYVCQTCQSRFRRLHDLKRHTKLHTGERPHICPKCGRKFARGDALARHNKGQGGCAGRRSSMGSYGGEDEFADGGATGPVDDSMDGLMYTEPDRMDEDDERQLGMPSIKKPNTPSEPIPRTSTTDHSTFQPRQPSTYPPIAVVRPQQGGLFPPTSHGSSSSTSPISQAGNMAFAPGGGSGSSNLNAGQQQQQGSPSIFSRANMRESPKPLSPNQSNHGTEGNVHSHQQHRARSPSMNQQYQQQYFQRGSGSSSSANHNPPSGQGSLGLPPPNSSAPQLPPPPGLNPPDSRYTLHSQGSVAAQQNQQHAQSSIPPTHSHSHSQGRQPQNYPQTTNPENSTHHNNTTNNNNNLFTQPLRTTTSPGPITSGDNGHNNNRNDDRIWMYIRSLEEKVDGLQNEVIGLRSQVAAAAASGIPGTANSAAGQTQESGSNGKR